MKRRIGVVGVLASGVLLSGCGPYAPRSLPIVSGPEAVEGTWVHNDEDSSTGATMTFRSDGTFSFDGLPADMDVASGTGCNDVIATTFSAIWTVREAIGWSANRHPNPR